MAWAFLGPHLPLSAIVFQYWALKRRYLPLRSNHVPVRKRLPDQLPLIKPSRAERIAGMDEEKNCPAAPLCV
jgi:hypothetical protein